MLRQAGADLFEEAQREGPSVAGSPGKGGRMPIDTGFLRASFVASLDGVPSGPTSGDGSFSYDVGPVELVLLQAEIGDVISAGWTAEYAPYMEHKYGFMRAAAQNWNAHVERAVKQVIARYP